MFLRVDQNKGLFYFDATYRPCPLSQQFVGINEKRALKRYQANNEVCYEKILESVSEGNQVIVFVHSRKDTFKTAKWIRDKLLENNQLNKLLKSDSGSIEILKQESENCKDSGLKDLLPTGFALHHAGLNRSDRSLSEDLFAAGYIQVLVSTSTLAWGVNLPAHTVIIKGTNVYSPEKGTWVELSAQDILQMLGRAGRPRYDKSGEGIIITSQDEIQYYLAILNQQLPIESQMMGKLVNSLNAEVVLGNVKSRDDCVDWLGYTYLFVRMLHSPVLYHVGPEYKDDKLLTEKREDLVHSALTILDKNKLIIYDANTGSITSTELGKIASYYYISYESMNLYNQQLKFFSSPIDILRIFAQSGEFKYIPVRQEEKMEVSKLLEKAPIPIKEAAADPLAKINVLLQSYISRLKLDGFALVADMVYIVQSAGRLLRAIYEIALKKKWSALTRTLLNLSKMVDKRMWLSNSPFRQFPNVPYEIIRKTENSQMPWSHYFNLSDPAEMSQAIRSEKYGRTAFELLKSFPRLTMAATAQPITPSLLRVELEVLPEWDWNVEIHGYAESFLLLVEDCNGENILFNDTFLVRKNYINQEHVLEFTVPILEPLQPNYFISLISERWLHCEAKIPLRFGRLKVPKKFPAPTQLLNLQLTPVTDLKIKEFENVFGFEYFNKFQTQAFQSLYNSNENVLIGMSKGSGKTVCAELSLLNHWKQSKGRAVYISPSQEKIGYTYKDWKKRFSGIAGGKLVDKLTGELTQDLKILENSHLILSTPQQFDTISRRWKYRKNIQQIGLFIIDDCHTIGNGYAGTVYEVIISRMRFIHARLENDLRIVGLTTSLANGKDFAEWIGVSKNNLFNFSSKERINPLEIRLQSFDIHHNPSLILSMIRPIFQAVAPYSEGESNVTIFVPSRKHCVEISAEFVKSANSHDIDFLKTDLESIEPFLVKISDAALKESLTNGIGYYYKDMLPGDKSTVEKLFNAGVLSILFATRETCFTCPVANFVVVLSTQYYEGKEHRYIDYPINELLEMIGTSVADEGGSAKCAILTNSSKRDYYKKFLNEPLPVESHLNIFLHDALINEITTKTVNSRQDCIDWLTFSYFYRRLQFNPSFYGVENTSHLGISEYLSELIENTLKDLVDAKLVEVEDDEEEEEEEEEENKDDEESEAKVEIVALNGAMIAAYYNISFISMQTFTLSLTNKTKLKGLLEIITSASELEAIPVRKHEDEILSKIYNRLPIKSSNPNYESPFFKSFILLQAHFSRIHLPHDLVSDQKFILEKILNLLYACIDILSSEGYLNAITAMDISQMIVQAVWDSDPPLKQIPFFSADILERCASAKVESVYDIMTLEDDERNNILKLSDRELSKVAEFVNNYPNVDLSYQLDTSEPMIANEDREIIVTLERDEEVDDLTVVAPHYPFKKLENWWVVVGDPKMRQLYAIKRTTIPGQSKQIKLDFSIPTAGHHKLSIWCMCDSYVDADKELSFEIDVEESEDAENKSDANSED
ncbi:hypothetical protein PACTADRAFT_48513 [Pachysolen tannophilus NRRL Y-2460]|uniref:RNA helicase n=1 Tax=Pachysolen tannophilus NRRL Y-2460 TaxID=669874 RepID=A0A1E4TY84_PACTA|nr:hypothetical protein PACTADRAFT_48513 [Pachysolen tannophilus NRRL Y-2460]